jgi:hypothetical protein
LSVVVHHGRELAVLRARGPSTIDPAVTCRHVHQLKMAKLPNIDTKRSQPLGKTTFWVGVVNWVLTALIVLAKVSLRVEHHNED